jgi:hypothetical protein
MSRQGQEPANTDPDRYIEFFQSDINHRQQKIEKARESNRYSHAQSTADFYQLAYYKITFHLEIMNWLDQRRINRLRNPYLSEEERESIHQVYHDRQKGILKYLLDKIIALFSMFFGLFSSPKPKVDEHLHQQDSEPVIRRRDREN